MGIRPGEDSRGAPPAAMISVVESTVGQLYPSRPNPLEASDILRTMRPRGEGCPCIAAAMRRQYCLVLRRSGLARAMRLLLCSLLLVAPAGSVQGVGLVDLRKAFLQAEQALSAGQDGTYQDLKAGLSHYLLLPYLEYAELSRRLATASSGQVRHFLDRYADTPLADRLRAAWLNQLAGQQRWREYLDFFTSSRSTELRCHHLQALIATGHRQAAFSQVQPLWLVGHSQPDACDPVLSAWIGAGRLTPTLAWQRIALAMDAGQTGLVRYLERFLGRPSQTWVSLWLRVRADPTLILDADAFAKDHPQRAAILIYGLERLARQQPQQAPQAWETLKRRFKLNPTQEQQARHAVAMAYLRFADLETLEHLTGSEIGQDPQLRRKRILVALEAQDWQRVLSWIDALPPEERDTERWRYWRGRALLCLGRQREAADLLSQVAKDRTYYAFLAADRIGLSYYLPDRPLEVDAAAVRHVEQQGAAQRARELRALDRMADARREWWWLTKGMDKPSLKAAARLAANWGWHDQAIFTLARSDYWDDLNLRFPVEHLALVKKNARENGLRAPWVLAVMRQESAFAADALSGAGARGLMQLMPATARQVARRTGQPRPDVAELFEPATNIPLGTAYLSEIYRRLGDHPVLATAAYNAGPHRVLQWLPEHTLDADIWVETIPFRETRTYVQRVMAYAVIYEMRLGLKPSSIVQRMRPIAGTADGGGST
jgi:peptidoglycan lytic transglycosylase